MPVRQLIRRASLIGSALLLVVGIVAPSLSRAADPDEGRPTSWESSALTQAIGFQVNTDPLLLPFQDLLRFDFAEGNADFDAYGADRGRASTVWPGDAVVKGLPALCDNFTADNDGDGEPDTPFQCPPGFPPAWPFTTTAEGGEDAHTDTSQSFSNGPFSGKLSVARAHSGRDFVDTEAVINDFTVADPGHVSQQVADNMKPHLMQAGKALDDGVRQAAAGLDNGFRQVIEPFASNGLPVLISPSFAVGGTIPGFQKAFDFSVDDDLISAERIVGRTRQEWLNGNKVLQSRSESVLSGVKLFGGLVTFDTIRTSAIARSDGDNVTEVAHDVKVVGMKVANVPAGLTDKGVAMGADGILAGTRTADIAVKLDNVLGATGLDLSTVGTSEQNEAGNVLSGATGVLVHAQIDISSLPAGTVVFSTLTLGNSGARAFVPPPFSFDETPGGSDLPPLGGGFTPPIDDTGTDVLAETASTGGGFDYQPGPADFDQVSSSGDNVAAPSFGNGPRTEARFGIELLSGLAAHRMTLFYLSWTLGMLFLALGSRAWLPRLFSGTN